jgi:hypothetical protein
MTSKQKAINAIVNEFKGYIDERNNNTWMVERYGEIETWKDFMDNQGWDNGDLKEEVAYTLKEIGIYFDEEDYSLIEFDDCATFRQLMNEVRKELKKQGYLK